MNDNKIYRMYKIWLKIFNNNKQPLLKALHGNDVFAFIYEKNIHILSTEIFKVSHNFSPPHIRKIFKTGVNIPVI